MFLMVRYRFGEEPTYPKKTVQVCSRFYTWKFCFAGANFCDVCESLQYDFWRGFALKSEAMSANLCNTQKVKPCKKIRKTVKPSTS
jgi:hypothetical protein